MSAMKIQPQAGPILITRGLSAVQVIEKVAGDGYRHVIQENSLALEQEKQTAALMQAAPEEFILDPLRAIFGRSVEKNQIYFRRKYSALQSKHAFLKDVGALLLNGSGLERIQLDALTICDEFYTNAAKNAWSPGKNPHTDVPEIDGQIEISIAADDERFVICCNDSFGRLNSERLIEIIRRCAKIGVAAAINRKSSGAGIGTFMVFDSAVALYLATDAGRSSVICAALPLGFKQGAGSSLPKNIHIAQTASPPIVQD